MADNQDYVIKTTEGDYVVPFKLKVAIDNILLLDISNDKKVKMLKYLLSINFDLKITNNAIIIQMLNDFIGEQITNEVLRIFYEAQCNTSIEVRKNIMILTRKNSRRNTEKEQKYLKGTMK